ncbi:MAG: hypothetical protein K2N95_09660, partial [Lachnospiraceae bacterium]|nr:hypothetical protein [Lachnospiraceae bacterium]
KPNRLLLSKEFFKGADIDIEVKAKVIYESDTDDIINQYIINRERSARYTIRIPVCRGCCNSVPNHSLKNSEHIHSC